MSVAQRKPSPAQSAEMELQVLRGIGGHLPPRPWGAVVGQALEVLRARGYIDEHHRITPQGKALLKEHGL